MPLNKETKPNLTSYDSFGTLYLLVNSAHRFVDRIFSMWFSDFDAQELKSIPTPSMVALLEFLIQMLEQISSDYQYRNILILVYNGKIYVLARI